MNAAARQETTNLDDPASELDVYEGEVRAAVRSRKPWGKFMKLVRRVHLYSGIFFFPWVMLYGITAMLFNHPTWFSVDPIVPLQLTASIDGQLDRIDPDAIARLVVAKINEQNQTEGNGSSLTLDESQPAKFTRDLAATSKSGGSEHTVRLDLSEGAGDVRTRTVAPAQPTAPVDPWPYKSDASIDVAKAPIDKLKQNVRATLERRGITSPVEFQGTPELAFRVSDGKRLWNATYAIDRGSVSARPSDAPVEITPLPVRRYLTRLHLARGYTKEVETRWWWALSVDGMFVSMVFWGASGL